MRTIIRFCILGIALCLFGCGGLRGASNLSELAQESQEPQDYRVSPGDTLRVEVWGEPRLSGEVFVRPDGRFTLALIGEVTAEGKSLREVTADITKRLNEFVPGASVTMGVVQNAPIRYYLSGSFVKPGEFRSDSRISFLQAIATGGGFAPFADTSSLLLIRKAPEGEKRYQFRYDAVINGREPNPQLKDGDVIAVQ